MSEPRIIAQDIIRFLKENSLYEHLEAITGYLQEEADRNHDISVISAAALSEPELDELTSLLVQKWGEHRVIITVDPSILSGIIVRFKDYIIDASGKNALRQLKQELI